MIKVISNFNDVIGPQSCGPTSPPTAASYRFGFLARNLLGDEPVEAQLIFDSNGSYARVYREQNSDLALVADLIERDVTDQRFLSL